MRRFLEMVSVIIGSNLDKGVKETYNYIYKII